jgi:hypothetical protein
MGKNVAGDYKNVFDGTSVTLTEGMSMDLKAWDYMVLEKE